MEGTREALNRIRWNMGGSKWDQMERGRKQMGSDGMSEALSRIRSNMGVSKRHQMEGGRH